MRKSDWLRLSKIGWLALVLSLTGLPAAGQKFDLNPFVTGRFFGSVAVAPSTAPQPSTSTSASLESGIGFGVATGFRFDDYECELCSRVEFRWFIADSHLSLANSLPSVPHSPSVTMNYFLGDFTREFPQEGTALETNKVRPFLTASAGAGVFASPASTVTRFVFGIGAGIDVSATSAWAVRFQVQYLPVVRQGSLQSLVCGAGGCVVAVSGGLVNQLTISLGPVIRF